MKKSVVRKKATVVLDEYFFSAVDFEHAETYMKAILEYNKILHSDPSNVEALRGKARCLLEIADWREPKGIKDAYKCSKKILDSGPDDADATAMLARCLIFLSHIDWLTEDRKKLRQAESVLSRALEKHPDNPALLKLMCSVNHYLSNEKLVKKYLSKLEKINYYYEGASTIRGNLSFSRDLVAALIHYEDELKRHPKVVAYACNKINALYKLGRIDDLIEYADDYIKNHGNQRDLLLKAGLFCYDVGHDAYNEQLKLIRVFQNKFPPVYVDEKKNAGDKKYMSKYGKAQKKLNADYEILDKKKIYYLEKASGRYKTKKKGYFDLMEHDKIDTIESKYFKMQCYLDLNKFDEALTKIDEIIEMDNSFRIEITASPILAYRAYALYRLGIADKKNYRKAITTADKVLKTEPRNSTASAAKTNSLFCLGRMKEYQKEFDKWKEANRSDKKEEENEVIYENLPGNDYTNSRNYRGILTRSKEYIWIFDNYVNPTVDFDFLDDALKDGAKVKEIRILTGFRGPNHSREDDLNRINRIKKQGQLLKAQYKESKLDVRIKIKRSDVHARYIISKDRVWNSIGTGQVVRNQMDDIQLIESEKIADNKRKYFNNAWDDPSSLQLLPAGQKCEIVKIREKIEGFEY